MTRPSPALSAQPALRRSHGTSKNTAEARRLILESAIHEFGSQGFAATSTEQVAEQAGYSQAALFFHFKTKAGLLEACLDHALERATAALIPTGNSGTLDLVRRLDQVFEDAPLANFFARMLSELAGNAKVGPIYAGFHLRLREMIEAELLRETGTAPDHARRAAATILSMIVGVHAEHRVAPAPFDREDYRAMLLKVTALVLADLKAG
jgi:AcrR family transcriptional regulator